MARKKSKRGKEEKVKKAHVKRNPAKPKMNSGSGRAAKTARPAKKVTREKAPVAKIKKTGNRSVSKRTIAGEVKKTNSTVMTTKKKPTDKKTRYSDAELKEFKKIIFKKLAEAHQDLELLKASISLKDDHGTDDTSPTFKILEDGSETLSREETSQLAARQQKFIEYLKAALVRIENKTYGICRKTGKLISKERLRVVPHATLSIDAKREENSKVFG